MNRWERSFGWLDPWRKTQRNLDAANEAVAAAITQRTDDGPAPTARLSGDSTVEDDLAEAARLLQQAGSITAAGPRSDIMLVMLAQLYNAVNKLADETRQSRVAGEKDGEDKP